MIAKEQVIKLEDNFDKDKQYYNLCRIKARTKENEVFWIFFGIHVGNTLDIRQKMQVHPALMT